MTIEEIRKNAPQGATHYTKEGRYFKVIVYSGIMKKYIYLDGDYRYCGKSHKIKPL